MKANPLTGTTAPLVSLESDRILAILWTGATSEGNVARVEFDGGGILWEGTAHGVYTYQGINFGPAGIPAPKGVRVSRIDAGRVFVYFME